MRMGLRKSDETTSTMTMADVDGHLDERSVSKPSLVTNDAIWTLRSRGEFQWRRKCRLTDENLCRNEGLCRQADDKQLFFVYCATTPRLLCCFSCYTLYGIGPLTMQSKISLVLRSDIVKVDQFGRNLRFWTRFFTLHSFSLLDES